MSSSATSQRSSKHCSLSSPRSRRIQPRSPPRTPYPLRPPRSSRRSRKRRYIPWRGERRRLQRRVRCLGRSRIVSPPLSSYAYEALTEMLSSAERGCREDRADVRGQAVCIQVPTTYRCKATGICQLQLTLTLPDCSVPSQHGTHTYLSISTLRFQGLIAHTHAYC